MIFSVARFHVTVRWVVERTFSHLSNARRTVRDYERSEETHEAMVRWAAIRLMTR
ncbi:transposase, partial [Actinospica durhamensis]|nr:transposase [Actinospica durhamensis]